MSNKKSIVISQPMLFPWVGMFEQIRLADVFIFYDDVQFSKGSFTNRVQLKSKKGSEWMTIPLEKFHLGQNINEIVISNHIDWKNKHLIHLERCYEKTIFFEEMMTLVKSVYDIQSDSLSEITIASMKAICNYFDLTQMKTFCLSSEYNFQGQSSERVLNSVLHFNGSRYITGHGAQHYLDHELFNEKGIKIEYMNYKKVSYPQLFGAFTPYVTILDLIANCGKKGSGYICSDTIDWRDISQILEK